LFHIFDFQATLGHHSQSKHVSLQLLIESEPGVRIVFNHQSVKSNVLVFKEEKLSSQVTETMSLTQILDRVLFHYVPDLMQKGKGKRFKTAYLEQLS
jgi:hypothetical protein